ncbi:MAG: PaaX family transcriptional regulator [Actinomycetes bacterium]
MTPQRQAGEPAARVESLLLALFGEYVMGTGLVVSTTSLTRALGRLDVSAYSTRTTLARMTRRGLLTSHRGGRKSYLALTDDAESVLRDGKHRLDSDVVNSDWDGCWTVLGFTIPEARRGDRHRLRARLQWTGFGLLPSGLWVAASSQDPHRLLEGLGLTEYVEVFHGTPALPGNPSVLAQHAWNLPALDDRYTRFVDRWSGPDLRAEYDELACQILLTAEWLLLVRDDPRLPESLLPEDWVGLRAQRLFRKLRQEYTEPARSLAGQTLETHRVGSLQS